MKQALQMIVFYCTVLVIPPSHVFASDALEKLKKPHEAAIAKLDLNSKVAKEKLDRAYLEALEGLQKKYRVAGDLDRLVPVKKETERFKKSAWIHSSNLAIPHPPLFELQKKYLTSDTKLRQSSRRKRLELLHDYGSKLTETKAALTKTNQIDDAVAVEAERKKLLEQYTKLNKASAPKVTVPPKMDGDSFDLPVNIQWPYKTKVRRGETIHIKASGYWRVLRGGKKRGPGDKVFYLAARLDGGDQFWVGKEFTLKIEKDATLELTMWEGGKYSNNNGKISIELTRTRN